MIKGKKQRKSIYINKTSEVMQCSQTTTLKLITKGKLSPSLQQTFQTTS